MSCAFLRKLRHGREDHAYESRCDEQLATRSIQFKDSDLSLRLDQNAIHLISVI